MDHPNIKKTAWLKIIGIAVLIDVAVLCLSMVVAFIYSTVINPGQSEELYAGFKAASTPYVSAIAGSILVYLFILRISKGKEINPFIIAIRLPIVYAIVDFALIQVVEEAPGNWATFVVPNATRLVAGITAAYKVKLHQKALKQIKQ